MNNSFNITQKVRVNNNQVSLNDHLIFHSDENGIEFATACYKHLNINYPKFFKMDLMSKWGIICTELLLQNENLDDIDEYKKAIVLQNSSSSLQTDRKFQQSIREIASPVLFVYTLPNIVMGEIAIRNKFKGENTFFVSPAFDEAQLTDYAGILFKNKIADVVICGFLEVGESSPDITLYLIKK